MVLDYSKFQNLNSDDDSDEYIHPNIDRNSWLKMRRQQRALEKQKKVERLREIEARGDSADSAEREKLVKELTPKIKEVDSSTVTYQPSTTDCTEHLLFLINHSTLEEFTKYMEDNLVCLDELEEITLLSLSENIKSGNNEGARILSKISLYLKYARQHGKVFMKRLAESLMDKERLKLFEEECENHFLDCKRAIAEHTQDRDFDAQ
jgi:hypothetical protein